MSSVGNSVTLSDWLVKIGLLVLSGAIFSVLEWLVHRRLLPHFKRKNHVWRTAFLEAEHRPVQIYIWFLVVSFVATTIAAYLSFDGDFSSGVAFIRRVMTVVFVFWFAMRFIRRVENGLVKRAQQGIGKINDQTSVHALSQLTRVTIIVIILLIALQTAGIKISALLAFGGVGALVIGYAAKDNLANFIGGMMIYWDRPFSVGDWVRSMDNQIEGIVENIGWRLTRIRTFDKRPLYVPNGILSNIALENPSRMTNRRIKCKVGVRYNDAKQVASISKSIEEMLRKHPEIDTDKTLFVYLSEFGPSSLNMLVYTFTKTTQWVKFQAIQQDVFLKIIDIVVSHGAECAFPTSTIHVPESVHIKEKEATSEVVHDENG